MKGGVLIRKIEDNNIRLESLISSIMPVDAFDVEQDINGQIERYSKWPITNWWCKPKALLAARFNFLNTIKIYKALQTIKDIKRIIVYDWNYWIDGGNLQNLHNFMKYYPEVKIMHSHFDFDHTKSISKTITLAYPSFLIINIYNATPVKWDSPEVKIEGNVIEIITINNESWILFEIGKLSSRKFIIQDDSKSFTNVLNDQTLTKRIEDIRNKDKNAFWLLFKLNNIIKFEATTVDSISTLSKSKMLRSIQINVKFGEFELNELIQHFYSIPRHLHLGFRISFKNSYPSEEDEIWRFILKIKNIELQSQRSTVLKVIEKIGESNIDDLNESSFKILIGSLELEVTFKDLYSLLKD